MFRNIDFLKSSADNRCLLFLEFLFVLFTKNYLHYVLDKLIDNWIIL